MRTLTYITNYTDRGVQVAIEAGGRPVASIQELRENVRSSGGGITVPGRQTVLCEIQQ